jgi:hypothetical protein
MYHEPNREPRSELEDNAALHILDLEAKNRRRSSRLETTDQKWWVYGMSLCVVIHKSSDYYIICTYRAYAHSDSNLKKLPSNSHRCYIANNYYIFGAKT